VPENEVAQEKKFVPTKNEESEFLRILHEEKRRGSTHVTWSGRLMVRMGEQEYVKNCGGGTS
jgi:hypothetical protein